MERLIRAKGNFYYRTAKEQVDITCG